MAAAVRVTRARAWLTVRDDSGEWLTGRELMTTALEELASVVTADPEHSEHLEAEAAQTHHQFAKLLHGACEEALCEDGENPDAHRTGEEAPAHALRAAGGYGAFGESGRHARAGAELSAAWIEADLGRTEEAAAHARGVLAEYDGETGRVAQERTAEAGSILEYIKSRG